MPRGIRRSPATGRARAAARPTPAGAGRVGCRAARSGAGGRLPEPCGALPSRAPWPEAGEGTTIVDFRYHLVSIIAIFLALALGIVVGTTALNGALLDNLEASIGTLTAEKRALESDVNEQRDLVAGGDQLVEQLSERTVAGVLTGERVVLVSSPAAPSSVRDEVRPLLEAAGAEVAGEVRLRPDLSDPARQPQLGALLDAVTLPGLDLGGADTPADRAAVVLAASLVRSPGQEADLGAAEAATVLQAFAQADLVDVEGEGELGPRSTLAVVLGEAPDPVPDPQADPRQTALVVAVAEALDTAGAGAVVAAPLAATEDGGVLRAVRNDGALSARLTTVDGVERPAGRLALVFALREQTAGGAGRYGTGPGATGPLPALPTP